MNCSWAAGLSQAPYNHKAAVGRRCTAASSLCATRPVIVLQDALFKVIAEMVPGIQDNETDDEFDLAAMMAKQKAQSAALQQEAQKLRLSGPACAPPLRNVH